MSCLGNIIFSLSDNVFYPSYILITTTIRILFVFSRIVFAFCSYSSFVRVLQITIRYSPGRNVKQVCVLAVDRSSTSSREVDVYVAERNKYKERSQQQAKKGSEREAETLKMLAAFQSKMERSRKLAEYVSAGVVDDDDDDNDEDDNKEDDDDVADAANDLSWLVRRFLF